MANSTGVRGSIGLCTGWPMPGITALRATCASTISVAIGVDAVARRTILEGLLEHLRGLFRTAGETLPTPQSPAATAACKASGAARLTRRVAMACGVMPCSTRVTRSALNVSASSRVGRRPVISRNAMPPRSICRSIRRADRSRARQCGRACSSPSPSATVYAPSSQSSTQNEFRQRGAQHFGRSFGDHEAALIAPEFFER